MNDNFYLFRSEIQHEIKRKGMIFILDVLENNSISQYFEAKEYVKCFYLLACIDTLCDEYNFPICSDYDIYRTKKLSEPLYLNNQNIENVQYLSHFIRHNIYEVTIHDAC